jgi:GT2 family glycosyltransferase
MSGPRVSVIVPAFRSEGRIARCLEALGRQTFGEHEVIVVNSSAEEPTRARVADAAPRARFVQSAARLLPHDARNVGVASARAPLFVFTDPDCVADPDWLARLTALAEGGERAVAGTVLPEHEAAGAAVGAFACKFRGVLPVGPRVRRFGQTANLLVERDAFDAVGGFRPALYAADVALCVDLARIGVRTAFEPGAVVRHGYDAGVRSFVRERMERGADFGAVRPELEGWSRGRAALHAATSPLAGLRAASATVRTAEQSGLRLGPAGVATALVGQLAWCAGEAAGYVRAIRTASATV